MLGILVEMLLEWTAWILFHFASEILLVVQVSETISLDVRCVALCHYEVMLELQQNHENSGYTKLVGGSNFEPI